MLTILATVLASGLMAAQAPGAAEAKGSETLPRHIQKFLDACETMRRGAIEQLEFELRGLRASQGDPQKTARRISKIEAHLAALRASKEPVVPALHFPPEVGAIGRLPDLACHIDQILSDNEMLVQCMFKIKVRAVKNFRPRLETVVHRTTFLVRGVDTRKLNAASDIQLIDVFEITGTHTYKSVSGTSITVRVLTPFDMKAVEPYFRAMANER